MGHFHPLTANADIAVSSNCIDVQSNAAPDYDSFNILSLGCPFISMVDTSFPMPHTNVQDLDSDEVSLSSASDEGELFKSVLNGSDVPSDSLLDIFPEYFSSVKQEIPDDPVQDFKSEDVLNSSDTEIIFPATKKIQDTLRNQKKLVSLKESQSTSRKLENYKQPTSSVSKTDYKSKSLHSDIKQESFNREKTVSVKEKKTIPKLLIRLTRLDAPFAPTIAEKVKLKKRQRDSSSTSDASDFSSSLGEEACEKSHKETFYPDSETKSKSKRYASTLSSSNQSNHKKFKTDNTQMATPNESKANLMEIQSGSHEITYSTSEKVKLTRRGQDKISNRDMYESFQLAAMQIEMVSKRKKKSSPGKISCNAQTEAMSSSDNSFNESGGNLAHDTVWNDSTGNSHFIFQSSSERVKLQKRNQGPIPVHSTHLASDFIDYKEWNSQKSRTSVAELCDTNGSSDVTIKKELVDNEYVFESPTLFIPPSVENIKIAKDVDYGFSNSTSQYNEFLNLSRSLKNAKITKLETSDLTDQRSMLDGFIPPLSVPEIKAEFSCFDNWSEKHIECGPSQINSLNDVKNIFEPNEFNYTDNITPQNAQFEDGLIKYENLMPDSIEECLPYHYAPRDSFKINLQPSNSFSQELHSSSSALMVNSFPSMTYTTPVKIKTAPKRAVLVGLVSQNELNTDLVTKLKKNSSPILQTDSGRFKRKIIESFPDIISLKNTSCDKILKPLQEKSNFLTPHVPFDDSNCNANHSIKGNSVPFTASTNITKENIEVGQVQVHSNTNVDSELDISDFQLDFLNHWVPLHNVLDNNFENITEQKAVSNEEGNSSKKIKIEISSPSLDEPVAVDTSTQNAVTQESIQLSLSAENAPEIYEVEAELIEEEPVLDDMHLHSLPISEVFLRNNFTAPLTKFPNIQKCLDSPLFSNSDESSYLLTPQSSSSNDSGNSHSDSWELQENKMLSVIKMNEHDYNKSEIRSRSSSVSPQKSDDDHHKAKLCENSKYKTVNDVNSIHKSNEMQKRSSGVNSNSKKQYSGADRAFLKAIDERRVIHVGDMPEEYGAEELRMRFGLFGEIEDIRIKWKRYDVYCGQNGIIDGSHYDTQLFEGCSNIGEREYGKIGKKDKVFGFITFKTQKDAIKAIEKGNEDTSLPILRLNFGGRRSYVGKNWTDYDGKIAESEGTSHYHSKAKEDDFLALLKKEQKRHGLTTSAKLCGLKKNPCQYH